MISSPTCRTGFFDPKKRRLSLGIWVVDIETAPLPRSAVSANRLKRIETEICDADKVDPSSGDEFERCVDKHLCTHPATGKVVCIGAYSAPGGFAYFNSEEAEAPSPVFGQECGGFHYDLFFGNEAKMIEWFFGYCCRPDDRLVTFGGRSFDLPFLSVRAMVHGLKLPRPLDVYRYEYGFHTDLAEVLTHRGSSRLLGLEDYCLAFGIDSPKGGPVSQGSVGGAWEKAVAALTKAKAEKTKAKATKQAVAVTNYCFGDVVATLQLYMKVGDSLRGVVKGF
jgi:hypothetical protein